MSVVKSQKYSFQFREVACFKRPGLFHPRAAYQTMFQSECFSEVFLNVPFSPLLPDFQLESGSSAGAYDIIYYFYLLKAS